MKSRFKWNAIGAALAVAGGLTFSAQAVADTVTANLSLVSGKSGSINVSAGGGGAGLFRSSTQGGTYPGDLVTLGDDEFFAFCLNPNEPLNNSAIYSVAELKDAPVTNPGSPMGTAGQTAMEILLGNIFPDFSQSTIDNTTVVDLTMQEAFIAAQVAIWEVAYERVEDITSYSVNNNGTGSFWYNSSAGIDARVRDQANFWLGQLDTVAWQANQLSNLKALLSENTQDYLVQVVPIPAAAWLFGSAIVGVAALGRRRRKEKDMISA